MLFNKRLVILSRLPGEMEPDRGFVRGGFHARSRFCQCLRRMGSQNFFKLADRNHRAAT